MGLFNLAKRGTKEFNKVLSGELAVESHNPVNPLHAMWNAGVRTFRKLGDRSLDARNYAAARSGKALPKDFRPTGGNAEKGIAAGYNDWQRFKSLALYDKNNEFSYIRAGGIGIAGITGVSAAGRIASGGGLYRDSDGNFDIIGIPGI